MPPHQDVELVTVLMIRVFVTALARVLNAIINRT